MHPVQMKVLPVPINGEPMPLFDGGRVLICGRNYNPFENYISQNNIIISERRTIAARENGNDGCVLVAISFSRGV